MDNTRYLYRLGTTYYFRCRIPKDLHPWFNDKHEYKCSLRTKSPSSAKRLVKPHVSRTESTFILMRSGLLDDEHLKRLAHDYITYGSTGRREKVCSDAAASIGSSGSLDVANKVTQVSKDRLLSTIVEKYIQEYKDTENTAKTTIYELETKCRQLVRVVGDMDIKAVTSDTILEFLKLLKQMPCNMNKVQGLDGKSVQEIIATNTVKTLSDTTVGNYLGRISSFFAWAFRVGHIDRNPADGIKFCKKNKVRPDEQRKAYTRNDLNKLVAAYVDQAEAGMLELDSKPERFWIPFISIYSGMRLNEICQLHVEDIEQDSETEIWYFNVDGAEDESKTVKTASGRRLIPVHPVLISLGFLEYHETIVASNKPRLWMGLTKSVRGYHRNFAYWFLGHNTAKGFLRKYVTMDEKLNFHSFRHTFVNALKQNMVEKLIVAELAGHSNRGETFGRYGKPYELRTKLDAMQCLDYSIDLVRLERIARNTI
mgnify:CR=1 FL=1